MTQRDWGFPMLGAVFTAASVVGGVVAFVIAGALTTYCDDAENVARRHAIREAGFVIFLIAALVPSAWAGLARLRHRRAWPWATVTGLVLAAAVISGTMTQPGYYCLF